jgi:hypothetical protein
VTHESALLPVESPDPQALDPQTIGQLVQNQARELELRARELDLQQQQDRHSFEFSKEALTTQAQDRKDERLFQYRQRRNSYLLAVGIAVVVATMVSLAMWFNKDQVAMEIIKSIVLLLSGGGTGYAIGRHQAKKTTDATESDP